MRRNTLGDFMWKCSWKFGSKNVGELNEKIKRKAHVKQSFSLDFLERGTFTEYPKNSDAILM